jgi:hypothetical protein
MLIVELGQVLIRISIFLFRTSPLCYLRLKMPFITKIMTFFFIFVWNVFLFQYYLISKRFCWFSFELSKYKKFINFVEIFLSYVRKYKFTPISKIYLSFSYILSKKHIYLYFICKFRSFYWFLFSLNENVSKMKIISIFLSFAKTQNLLWISVIFLFVYK